MGNPQESRLGARNVCVVEWNEGGHHETYLRFFTSVLLRQGHRVQVFCRDSKRLKRGLTSDISAEMLARLDVKEVAGPEWIRERRRWPLGWAFGSYARRLLRDIKRFEQANGRQKSEIFFACLYEHQARMLHALVSRLGRRAWSGLYLQAHAFHYPGLLGPGVKRKWPFSKVWRHHTPRGMLVLDEGIAAEVERGIGCPVRVLPDLADSETRHEDALARELLDFAAGRPVVGIMGHLIPSKGVEKLARSAMANAGESVVFAFIGEVHWQMFTPETRELLQSLPTQCPNVWLHDARIADEKTYNALFQICDGIYAAYENFPHSSNTLTKAAIFEKPILVSNGHLMAERVRKYRLGWILPEKSSINELSEILLKMTQLREAWQATNQPDWQGYRQAHSWERFCEVMTKFFSNETQP